MEHMPLISVIVPVYKVEAYLDKCISSIVQQTYTNLEIILVDDGSPDNSGEICDRWAVNDDRIRVIHQKNAGGGAARNAALDIVRGEFIAFVDSDDYIAPDMYKYLYGLLIQGADIAECGHVDAFDDNASFDNADAKVVTYAVQEAMTEHIQDRIFRQLIWNKLYRRELIADIRFPVGNRIDDEFWTYRVIANARRLARSSCNMYAYRQQPGSVMHRAFDMTRLQAVDAKCQRLELLRERFPALLPQARKNLWYTCLYLGQMSLLHMPKEDKRKAFEKLSAALKQYPLTRGDKRSLPLKQKVWAILSDISFTAACKLRNSLKIGF